MHESKIFEAALKKQLIMNAARINFIACFIIALLKVSSVNLKKIAIAITGKAKKDSKYKRIQRFFHQFPLNLTLVRQAKLGASCRVKVPVG